MTADAEDGTRPLSVWVLKDPRAGTAAQALAVADAFANDHDVRLEVKPLVYGILSRLPNRLLGARTCGLAASSRPALIPPWPDVVISAGRRSAPVVRWIKRASGGTAFAVQIMYPGAAGLSDFDLVAVPNHDNVRDTSNMLGITGAAHGMTAARLEAARTTWTEKFATIATPRIAVLVGGSTQRKEFLPEMARAFGKACAERARSMNGSLLISTSRRTSSEAAEALVDEIKMRGIAPALIHRWGETGDNPYDGLIALADLIIVTGDSISMCCEAAAGSAPVEIFAPPGFVSVRHRRFIGEMFGRGFAGQVGAPAADMPHDPHDPLDPAREIAAEMWRRLGRG